VYTWTEELEVGVETIDSRHRELGKFLKEKNRK
jgi:hemerythrin